MVTDLASTAQGSVCNLGHSVSQRPIRRASTAEGSVCNKGNLRYCTHCGGLQPPKGPSVTILWLYAWDMKRELQPPMGPSVTSWVSTTMSPSSRLQPPKGPSVTRSSTDVRSLNPASTAQGSVCNAGSVARASRGGPLQPPKGPSVTWFTGQP